MLVPGQARESPGLFFGSGTCAACAAPAQFRLQRHAIGL